MVLLCRMVLHFGCSWLSRIGVWVVDGTFLSSVSEFHGMGLAVCRRLGSDLSYRGKFISHDHVLEW